VPGSNLDGLIDYSYQDEALPFAYVTSLWAEGKQTHIACDYNLKRSSHLPTPGSSYMIQRQVLASAAATAIHPVVQVWLASC
jgi:hypothetical protein